MIICKKCKSTSIKSRKNYSHGKKSRPITTLTCNKCGSVDIESDSNKNRKRGYRR